MKKILLFITTFLLLNTACTKHTIGTDRTLKVGNIYCSDGSVVDPDTYIKEGLDNAAGVIFWVNDTLDSEDKAMVVSLSNARKDIWCDSLTATGVSTSILQYNGAANTATLLSFQTKTGSRAPAMNIAVKFNEGIINWHLPSVAQRGKHHLPHVGARTRTGELRIRRQGQVIPYAETPRPQEMNHD